jgi:hypothetical protein
MTLIIIDDDGPERTLTDVIAYDCLCVDDIDTALEDYNVINKNENNILTDEQKRRVARICQNCERFPDMDDLRWIIGDVLREKEDEDREDDEEDADGSVESVESDEGN